MTLLSELFFQTFVVILWSATVLLQSEQAKERIRTSLLSLAWQLSSVSLGSVHTSYRTSSIVLRNRTHGPRTEWRCRTLAMPFPLGIPKQKYTWVGRGSSFTEYLAPALKSAVQQDYTSSGTICSEKCKLRHFLPFPSVFDVTFINFTASTSWEMEYRYTDHQGPAVSASLITSLLSVSTERNTTKLYSINISHVSYSWLKMSGTAATEHTARPDFFKLITVLSENIFAKQKAELSKFFESSFQNSLSPDVCNTLWQIITSNQLGSL